jgi:hypothetical protein
MHSLKSLSINVWEQSCKRKSELETVDEDCGRVCIRNAGLKCPKIMQIIINLNNYPVKKFSPYIPFLFF